MKERKGKYERKKKVKKKGIEVMLQVTRIEKRVDVCMTSKCWRVTGGGGDISGFWTIYLERPEKSSKILNIFHYPGFS